MSNLILPSFPLAGVPPRLMPQSSGALGVQPCLDPAADLALNRTRPNVVPLPTPAPSPRCSEKGCVFPVSSSERTECHYHELLRSEAELFQSHQPSHLLLLRAPLGVPEQEPDDSREQDRKRQAAEREAFILDEAA
jgi:hypothetical protein